MHPSIHAKTNPDKLAVVVPGASSSLTYRTLEERSNQIAHLFRSLGLHAEDVVAICLENCPEFFEIAWAAQRSGLIYVTISNKLTFDEVRYILKDSGAKFLAIGHTLPTLAAELLTVSDGLHIFSVGGELGSIPSLTAAKARQPTEPIRDETAGFDMLYSSGTTGRPKGIRPMNRAGQPIAAPDPVAQLATLKYGLGSDSVYLCPAPLYHAAPLRWTMAALRLGGTVIVLDRFDPEQALASISQYKVTAAQFVPTHFIRLLKLSDEVRSKYDLSSLATVIHAAAPCPVIVKEQMLDWLGPIIYEYYSGSEGNGGTFIDPHEWLQHKGSVGRPMTTRLHICDEAGNELPSGSEGLIYFSGGPQFEYHNDADKTKEARHSKGWSTLGDIGWVDDEGYLYLTDRKSFMIISGGVNIYPQEIENLLITHPKVEDAAVIGAPDPEMGEKVVAVVQPVKWADAGEGLRLELVEFARAHLSHVKAPRQFDFMEHLPRQDSGKLFKRLIRDKYWENIQT